MVNLQAFIQYSSKKREKCKSILETLDLKSIATEIGLFEVYDVTKFRGALNFKFAFNKVFEIDNHSVDNI